MRVSGVFFSGVSIRFSVVFLASIWLSKVFIGDFRQVFSGVLWVFSAVFQVLGLWAAKSRSEVFSMDRLGFLAAGDVDAATKAMILVANAPEDVAMASLLGSLGMAGKGLVGWCLVTCLSLKA